MNFINLVLFFLLVSGEILFLIRFLNFPAHTAPLTVMLVNTLILYLFALAGALRLGLYFTLVIGITFGIVALFKRKTIIHHDWFSIPIIAYLLIMVATYLYTRGTLFYQWDEFSHWGVIYRYLMTLEKLPKDLSSVIVAYPPFSALWQYFVSQIIGFKEENAYFAHILIQFSAIIALLPSKNWREWKKYCLALTASIFLVYIFNFTFQALYVDLLMGLFLAAGFAQSKIDGKYTSHNFLIALLISISLVLIKPMGLLFGLMVALVNTVAYVNSKDQNIAKPINFSNIFKNILNYQVVLLIIFPVIAWLSWGQYTKNFDVLKIKVQLEGTPISSEDIFPWFPSEYLIALNQQEIDAGVKTLLYMQPNDTTIGLKDIFRSFTINAPYRTKVIARNFMDTFSGNPLFSKPEVTLKLTLLALILLVGFNQSLIKNWQPNHSNMNLITNGLLFFGFIVYSIALYLAYIFIFGPSEATTVPSVQRYLGTYLLPWWLMNLMILYQISIDHPAQKEQLYSHWALGAFVAVFFLIIPASTYIHLPYSPNPARFEVNRIYKTMDQVHFQAQDKVYEVYSGAPSNDQGFRHYIMRYYLTPIPSNIIGWSIGKNDEENRYTVELTPSEWMDLLITKGYTYVLVSSSDIEFLDRYKGLFDQYSLDLTQPQLFKVTKGKLEFVPLD